MVAAASDTGELQTLERAHPGLVQELVPAEAVGLVALRDGQVQFSHVLARSAVYGAAAPDDRRSAHRALARALPDRDADRRAWHLALATVGPDETAASALAQAGDRAYARSAYAVAGAAYERAATLSAQSRPAALPGRGRDVARRPGRAGDLVPRRSASPPTRTCRSRSRSSTCAARSRRGAGRSPRRARSWPRPPSARRPTIRRPRRSCSPRRRTCRSTRVMPARCCGRPSGPTSSPRGLEGRAPILAGLALGMALILAGEGEAGARSIRAAVAALEASDELRDDPHLALWAAHGPLWLREAEAGRGLYERALEVVRSRSGPGRAPRAPLPRGPGLGDDQCLDQRARSVQRGDHARARDRAGRHARLRPRRARCARGPPGA